jgi:NAD(P)-dependent dehydrogenase (short-subunit alcohol dehydrogenase family)
MSIERKVAIITGASQGLGAELVRAYRNRNYRVVANSRSIAPSSDPNVLSVAGDIADPATAERVIREALARFGRIDTLVNNAGAVRRIHPGRLRPQFGGQRRGLLPHHAARRRRDAEAMWPEPCCSRLAPPPWCWRSLST